MHVVATLIAALGGAALFEKLGIPAGSLIGAMVAVTVVNLTPMPIGELPRVVEFLSFTAIGWLIAEGITMDVMRALVSNAPVIGVAVGLLLLFGGMLAIVLVKLGLLDPATAFLATSPGGLSQMAALSAAVGANGSLVATLHIVRVVAVIVIAPLILRLLPAGP